MCPATPGVPPGRWGVLSSARRQGRGGRWRPPHPGKSWKWQQPLPHFNPAAQRVVAFSTRVSSTVSQRVVPEPAAARRGGRDPRCCSGGSQLRCPPHPRPAPEAASPGAPRCRGGTAPPALGRGSHKGSHPLASPFAKARSDQHLPAPQGPSAQQRACSPGARPAPAPGEPPCRSKVRPGTAAPGGARRPGAQDPTHGAAPAPPCQVAALRVCAAVPKGHRVAPAASARPRPASLPCAGPRWENGARHGSQQEARLDNGPGWDLPRFAEARG